MNTLTSAPTLQVNEEGYLKNYQDWNRDWASEIAQQYNISLTPKHWDVLNWLRAKQAEGTALSIRKVGNSGIVDIKEFYALFPGGPLKISSKIAGIPKPASCI
ncbi:MAG: TusE/DsrC/DsvC family sulfur relay protein [Cyclobacteriaceae bacterium]|jgi:tRNA 2-thiouridine synthesizing protein E|nr:TusE/DsrC/DsvC family sulfur relay protein [Cyclobacteriaceae bacterium]